MPKKREEDEEVEVVRKADEEIDTAEETGCEHEHSDPVRADGDDSEADRDPVVRIDRWKNRRRMAWVALIAIILLTVSCFGLPIERIKALEMIITWFMTAMTTIVATYMGASTVAQIKGK